MSNITNVHIPTDMLAQLLWSPRYGTQSIHMWQSRLETLLCVRGFGFYFFTFLERRTIELSLHRMSQFSTMSLLVAKLEPQEYSRFQPSPSIKFAYYF